MKHELAAAVQGGRQGPENVSIAGCCCVILLLCGTSHDDLFVSTMHLYVWHQLASNVMSSALCAWSSAARH
jgi:hypothetical protein